MATSASASASALRSAGDDGKRTASDEDGGGVGIGSDLEVEIESLQLRLAYIEALESRNAAQIESFVDESDQWDSMEDEEREMLRSRGEIERRLEDLTEELVTMWMGRKAADG